MQCDINCDMGEGIGNDELIMPYITSANIACGYHAGDEQTMLQTILLAKKYNVKVGAHPSFFDRENFGRTEIETTADEIYELVSKQVIALKNIAEQNNTALHHVKPHGALYNMAARDKSLSACIAGAVYQIDKNLVLYGLVNSCLISEAKAVGLRTANEAFADRTYEDDGSLTPRSHPDALIENIEEAVQQVTMMVKHQKVKTVSGKEIPIIADTICIHGDGKNAIELAKAIHKELK